MIEKMKFVIITGANKDLDRMIYDYLSKYEIHLENPMLELQSTGTLFPYTENNPYKDLIKKGQQLLDFFGNVSEETDQSMTIPEAAELIQTLSESISSLQPEKNNLIKNRATLQANYEKIAPFIDLECDIEEIVRLKHIKYRFGRIPIQYSAKLEQYMSDNRSSIFLKCATDKEYVWGVYFVPSIISGKCDATYTSMHFERTFIPTESKGTPKEACEELTKKLEHVDKLIQDLDKQILKKLEAHKAQLPVACRLLQTASENFDIRKMATLTKNDGSKNYIICGWMTEHDAVAFRKEIEHDDQVVCILEEDHEAHSKTPPTKLKNPKLFRPFEMYIKMYGLPAYNEIDPTIFVALTYSFIFGAMFGDVGQGLVLAIAGFLLYKIKKMDLAAIIGFAGIFSTFFGFMFGSVFGFEDIIDAVWLHPGVAMTNVPFIGKLNTVFVVAIGFGMLLILFTMILHIINGIKNHDVENIFFDTNALAGLVFYGAIVAVVGLLMAGKPLPAAVVLIIMFVIPLLIIALKEPLTHMLTKKEPEEKTGIGMFITQAFFELFEVLLSYFSNTLSFIRIGAFAVSHVSMMEVVLMLAGVESGNPNMLVVVLGNLFVIGMEGLIVGIQVLRLEYYELFSRFYKGTGREFKPFKAQKL